MFQKPNPDDSIRLRPLKKIADKPPGDVPVLETKVEVANNDKGINTVADRHAKRLLDRVQRGETLAQASNAERIPVATLRNAENPIHQSLQNLIGNYFLPPEARKQMVRAGLNRMFLANVESTDTNQQRLALDAAKQIGADPEVGLNLEPTGGVVINIGELDAVFKQIQTAPVPEIIDGRSGRSGTDREVQSADDPEIIDAGD